MNPIASSCFSVLDMNIYGEPGGGSKDPLPIRIDKLFKSCCERDSDVLAFQELYLP